MSLRNEFAVSIALGMCMKPVRCIIYVNLLQRTKIQPVLLVSLVNLFSVLILLFIGKFVIKPRRSTCQVKATIGILMANNSFFMTE